MTITEAVNATGWNFLMNAEPVQAVFAMYDASLYNWTIAILFIVYQFMLLMKTRNLTLSFVMGMFFVSLYASTIFVKAASTQIMGLILIFEFGGILYYLLLK